MKALPIPMHVRSVQGLRAGHKTQTRRGIKPRRNSGVITGPAAHPGGAIEAWGGGARHIPSQMEVHTCPYGQPGDLLWVREPWRTLALFDDLPPREIDHRARIVYLADGVSASGRYRHARFMCRWMSRLTLHLTDVRVERVQAITAADIRAEGVELTGKYKAIDGADWDAAEFAELWDATNGPGAWLRNDWVRALTFELIEANVDDVLADPASYGIPEAA